jgi:predicted Rossmann fold flavoprotein
MMTIDALVIGAGPAGLMAAQELAQAGRRVTVIDAKPSPARKFLMAGKSGLNITNTESSYHFKARLSTDSLSPMIDAFGPSDAQNFCRALGQEVFTGSSGRVFPVAMKASPLLRAWLERLQSLGVELHSGWRWTGFDDGSLTILTPQGPKLIAPKVCVLALGGASWARLGSDGTWASILENHGVQTTPFQPIWGFWSIGLPICIRFLASH